MTIKELIGKENPTLEEIDDWICQLAEKTAINRWVLRSLVYGDLKVRVLKEIKRQ